MMKNLFIAILFICFGQQSSAQTELFNDVRYINNDENLITNGVSEAVIKSVTRDYEAYSIKEVYGVSIEDVIEDVLSNPEFDKEEFSTFVIKLNRNGENGIKSQMSLMYNVSGELLNLVEKSRNHVLPGELRINVAKNYPGWTITKNKFQKVYYKGKVNREHYKVILEKDNKKIRLYTDSCGNII